MTISASVTSSTQGAPIGGSLGGGGLDRLDDRGVGVAEDQRTPGSDIVDEAPAIGVGEAAAGASA